MGHITFVLFLIGTLGFATCQDCCKPYSESCGENVKPRNCADIGKMKIGQFSGVYRIWPRTWTDRRSILVYCDMEDDGGGWTVIQRRGNFGDPKEKYNRTWDDYKRGFGDLNREFWLGNDNIYSLTNDEANSVKIILQDWVSEIKYAKYQHFYIEEEKYKYQLHVKDYIGNAGDSLTQHTNMSFSTFDNDNDLSKDNSCAVIYGGGWWFYTCYMSCLNCPYRRGLDTGYGVKWNSFRGSHPLKDAVIKIRPRGFVL